MIKDWVFSKKGLHIATLIFLLFLVAVLPYVASLSEARSHTSFSPDTGFLYTPATFYDSMALYGESGRQFYIIMRWTFDVIWPIVYTAFFVSVIANLLRALTKPIRIKYLSVPLLAVAFDFIENTLATVNVGMYPNTSLFLLRLLQGATLLKWVLIAISGLLILYLLIRVFLKRYQNISKEKATKG